MSDYEDNIEADEPQTLSRYAKLGFRPQRELPWNKYLPYADRLDDESQAMLADVKDNLARAVAMRDINPGVGIYASKLMVYIKLYGLKFSKEDHIKFIKLFMELISLEYLEPAQLNKFCVILVHLFRKTYNLSPNDLEIEWRPLYDLFVIYLNKTSTKGNLYQYYSKGKNQNKKNLSSMFDQMFPLAKIVSGSAYFSYFQSDIENE